MIGNYCLAGKIIEINSVHGYIHKMCADYACGEPAELFVKTTADDIEAERLLSRRSAEKEGREDYNSPPAYLETLAVYRKIADRLIDFRTILFHGSAVAVDGECYLFTAKSGTGKSTHTANWRKFFGERAVMINDDKPLIRMTENGAEIYGTPWDGKHHLSTNTHVPLKAVCILTRAEVNRIEPVSSREAYSMILQQTHRIDGPEGIKKTLETVDLLMKNVKLYRLGCNTDISSAEVAYNGMKG